jgi:hypothetical protein
MAFNGTMQVVIDSTTKEVKRFGYCDMENDGEFEPGTETMVEKNFVFEPSIKDSIWTWNDTTFVEGGAQPASQVSQMIQQIDINKSDNSTSYKTVSRIIYLGSDNVGAIIHIEAISCMDSGITSYDMRVVDKGNGSAVIAEVTGSTNEIDDIVDFGTISNLPSSKSRFDIQLKRNGGNAQKYVHLDSILIKY